MSGPPQYMKPDEIIRELVEMAHEFVDEIVGGEECAGEDARRTHRAEVCARAADIIKHLMVCPGKPKPVLTLAEAADIVRLPR